MNYNFVPFILGNLERGIPVYCTKIVYSQILKSDFRKLEIKNGRCNLLYS